MVAKKYWYMSYTLKSNKTCHARPLYQVRPLITKFEPSYDPTTIKKLVSLHHILTALCSNSREFEVSKRSKFYIKETGRRPQLVSPLLLVELYSEHPLRAEDSVKRARRSYFYE